MTVTGFTLDKNDPTKRIPYEYHDNAERLWCEAAELADVKLWQEAEDKINAYFGLDGGFIRGSRDTMLNAKIAVGLATTKLEKKLFDNALQAMQIANRYDDGGSVEEFADWFWDLCQGYVKMKIPAKEKEDDEADFASASTSTLVLVAQQVLELLRMAYDADMEISYYNDNTHDSMQMIVDELVDRDVEKARPIVEELLNVDYGGVFKEVAQEEWNKKLNSTSKQDAESVRPSKKSRKSG